MRQPSRGSVIGTFPRFNHFTEFNGHRIVTAAIITAGTIMAAEYQTIATIVRINFVTSLSCGLGFVTTLHSFDPVQELANTINTSPIRSIGVAEQHTRKLPVSDNWAAGVALSHPGVNLNQV